MEQATFAELEHDLKKRRTRREAFLEKMDALIPWKRLEKRKASVRAKVEHPFLYLKRHFGYAKVRYRGLAKNIQRIAVLPGFTHLLIARRYASA